MLNSIFGGNNKKSITITREEFDNLKGQVEAISRSQAVIEFKTDGTIIVANDNFLQAIGYSLSDIVGKHHSMFVETAERNSRDYSEFWASLARGEFQAREFKRVANGGREIWIQASYNPIFDKDGNVFKVVKYASDITESKLRNADYKNQIQAIGRSQAVIEFDLEGRILEANENFLQTLGYTINEIRGQHHSMFVPSEIAHTNEYKDFWASLKRGDFQSGEFERRDKSGQSIWIQASYNPIRDMNGNPVKVVKYASDITATKTMQMTVEKLVAEVASVMDCLADGDLNKTVKGDYGPQFSELTGNVNSTVERLIQVSQSIKGSASTVSETAQEMSQSNMDLSGRTEQQAYSLEKTAASVEEITGIVQSNAQDAEEANHLAVEARNEAEKGGDVVRRAVDAMTQINDSSQEIADIIGVIDEIAFQTNLLALNASVEAARAGEQGRGFSVVASEVRNLAGRSATAAKEIKELIQDSVNKVNTGSSLVNDSGVVLDEIVGRVKKVASIIERISTASQEQAQGLTEINQAMNQMDQATQQNAALVEETAAVSETALQEAVSFNR